ncbi:hypothetical protein B0H13DRAFT_2278609, partial [Mycena leptocephala]
MKQSQTKPSEDQNRQRQTGESGTLIERWIEPKNTYPKDRFEVEPRRRVGSKRKIPTQPHTRLGSCGVPPNLMPGRASASDETEPLLSDSPTNYASLESPLDQVLSVDASQGDGLETSGEAFDNVPRAKRQLGLTSA